jgi:hypothetical protein
MRRQDKPTATVGKSFETGELAESIFCEWATAEHCLPRKQHPDIFIDYLVELVRDGEPTGQQFATQVKGVAVGRNSAMPRKFALKGKHVRYWLKDCQNPVFVFLIDVESRTGCWLFVQKYVKEHISPAALERQKSFTFCFAPEDSLNNREKFQSTLVEAMRFVRDLHPGSVQAALAKKRAELEAKEPRFNYNIVATEGNQAVHLSPKVPVSLKLLIDNHAGGVSKAISEAIETGAELKIPFSMLKIIGSPLFEEFNRTNGNLVMQAGPKAPGQLILSPMDAARRKPLTIEGTYVFGTKVATFSSANSDLPLNVKCKLGSASEPENMGLEMEVISSLRRWQGRSLLQLPYFEPLLDVLTAIVHETGVEMEFIVRGVSLAGGHYKNLKHPDMVLLQEFVAWIGRCQIVARHFGVNPLVPEFETITNEQWEVVEDLSALIAGNKRMVPMPELLARCTLRGEPENFLETGMHGCLRFDNEEAKLGLFGIRLNSPPIRLILTNVNLSPLPCDQEGCQVLEIRGTASTYKIVEKIAN